MQAGDRATAERLCRGVLKTEPANAHAAYLMGVILLSVGHAQDAIPWLQRAGKGLPGESTISENLGLAYLMTGKAREAEAEFRKVIASGQPTPSAVMRLGLALQAQARLPEALQALEQAAVMGPEIPDTHLNLGNAYAQRRAFSEARAAYQRVLEIQPGHPEALFNLGRVGYDAGDLQFAEATYRRLLESHPQYIDAWINLGAVLSDRSRYDEAMACFERALEINRSHPAALAAQGASWLKQGHLTRALATLQQAVALAPDMVDAQINLGVTAREAGLPPLAIASFKRALALQPGQADVHTDLAGALIEAGQLDAAETHLEKAIGLKPQLVAAHLKRADVATLRGDWARALDASNAALRSESDNPAALMAAVHQKQNACDWDLLPQLWSRLAEAIVTAPEAIISPFSFLSIPSTPEQQLEAARRWAGTTLERAARMRTDLGFDFSRRVARDRIRVGYLSSDFHRHATAYLIAEVLELHDRSRFEVFAYSYGVDDGSAMRQRIVAACDQFREVSRHALTDLARAIYDDGIDILVDLKGYTMGSRSAVLGLRPAPIQVNWLGYPGTLGSPHVDYLIGDPVVVPEGAEQAYAEKILRLADCYQPNDRKRVIANVPGTRAEAGLPESGAVLCCFNQSYKILPDIFGVWMEVLKATPDAILWLLECNPLATANLRREAGRCGVAPARIVYAPRLPMEQHLARYRLADLTLDTFPYGSHTTASDALWAGCPLVALAGATFASRVSASILKSAGLSGLITHCVEDYQQQLLALARNPERLRELHAELERGRHEIPLFDAPRFTRGLERAYAAIYARYLAGAPAENFCV